MDNKLNQYDNGGGYNNGNRGNVPGGGGGGNNGNGSPQRPNIVVIILAGLSALLIFFLFMNLFLGGRTEGEEVSYTQFLQYIEDDRVEQVEVHSSGEVYFTLKAEETQETTNNRYPGLFPGFGIYGVQQQAHKKYYTIIMEDLNTLTARLETHDIEAYRIIDSNSGFVEIIVTIVLPIVLMWIFLSLMFRKMGGSGGPMGVGKNNAKVYVQKETGVTFKDEIGRAHV